jgi:hypothetical protein
MGPIEITNVSLTGRQAQVTLQVDNSSPILAVNVVSVLLATGQVARYSDDGGAIRVKTAHPHGLAPNDRVLIADSAAVEANGEWNIVEVTQQEFTLLGSTWNNNSDPAAATWLLRNPEYSQPATGAGNTWNATVNFSRPGQFELKGQLIWNGTPNVVRSPPSQVTVT